MNHSRLLSLGLLIASASPALPACIGPVDPNGPAAMDSVPDGALTGTIGASGGVIAGQPGTLFEGVRLEIPAGALSQDTTVRIVPTHDTTPLPARAERVGAQFAIEPADLPLAHAAQLTLPVDAARVARFDQSAGDVKVWVRDGDGWSLREATATVDGSVTIALDSLVSAAAAGVRINAVASSCALIPSCVLLSQLCNASTGLCAQDLPGGNAVPLPEDDTGFQTDGQSLFYTSLSFSRLTLVRRSIATGEVAQSSALSPVYFFAYPQRNNPVVDTDGSVWMGIASSGLTGNAHFRFGASSELLDSTAGLGAVATADGTLVRLNTEARIARSAPTGRFDVSTTWPAPLHPSGTPFPRAAADLAAPDAFWVATSQTTMQRLRAATNDGAESVQLPPGRLDLGYPMVSAPASQGGGVAVLTYPSGGVVRVASGRPAELVAGLPAAFDLGYDSQGGLWLTALNAPEVFYRATNGALSAVSLAPGLAAGSDASLARIPRALRVLPDGSAVVFTRGGSFVRVRRNGTI